MLRACWVTHFACRVFGHANKMYLTSCDLHHDQHVQPPRADRVQVEEVDRQQAGGLRRGIGRIVDSGSDVARRES